MWGDILSARGQFRKGHGERRGRKRAFCELEVMVKVLSALENCCLTDVGVIEQHHSASELDKLVQKCFLHR